MFGMVKSKTIMIQTQSMKQLNGAKGKPEPRMLQVNILSCLRQSLSHLYKQMQIGSDV